jgi:hypothetical protein
MRIAQTPAFATFVPRGVQKRNTLAGAFGYASFDAFGTCDRLSRECFDLANVFTQHTFCFSLA